MPRSATEEECKILGVDASKPPTIYDPGKCEKCNNKGFKGRTAIIEVLRMDKTMDEMIATNATRSTIMEYALANGFRNMQYDGIEKVLKGEISLEELISTNDLTEKL